VGYVKDDSRARGVFSHRGCLRDLHRPRGHCRNALRALELTVKPVSREQMDRHDARKLAEFGPN